MARSPKLKIPTTTELDAAVKRPGLFTIEKHIEDDEYVKNLNELFTYSDRRRYQAWLRWNESWRLYNNQWDWSGKMPWQSKVSVPRIGLTVEMAASLIRRAMIDANEWFRLDGYTDTSKKMAPYLEKLIYYYLDLLKFVDNFVPPLKGGLVGSMVVLKPHLAPYTLQELNEEEVEKQLAGEMVQRRIIQGPAVTVSFPDPYNIWLDPTGRNMYIIEEEILDTATVDDLCEMGIIDGDAFLKAKEEDWTEHEKEVREETRKQQLTDISHPSFRRQMKLRHFWGSLPNEDGKWRIRNGHFVILNDKYLGRKPISNPYTHGKIPYIVGSPFKRPFSVYHKGLIEDVVSVAKAMTELMNLTLDSTLFAAIKAFEVDLDLIDDPQQIINGISPAKVFTKRAGGEQGKMIQEIEVSGAKREVIEVYGMLDSEFKNNTAVTDFISGIPGQGEKTATENVLKSQQGMGIFSEIARNLEGSVLEPLIEMTGSLVAQYHDDFSSPQVREILGDDLANELSLLAWDERLERFDPDRMKVRATGISALLNRQDEIQKIMGFLQAIGQFGQQLPMILQGFDVQYFFRGIFQRLVRSFGWNESELLRPAPPQPVGGAGPADQGAEAGPPGSSNMPGQPAPPSGAAGPAQMSQIVNAVRAGGMPPSRQG